MNQTIRDNPEILHEIFRASKRHSESVTKALNGINPGDEPQCNLALYYLAVWLKSMLEIVSIRFLIEQTEDDSIENLFNKTEQYLPAYIIEIKKEACYWYNEVRDERGNIMTGDEVYDLGHIIEIYFNKFIRVYCKEMYDRIKGKPHRGNIKSLDIFQ